MSHDATMRRVFGVTLETAVRRILRTFDRATASDLESGASWYPKANGIATMLAVRHDVDLEVAASVIAAFSPRTPWDRNVAAAVQLFESGHAEGVLGDNLARAAHARESGYAGLGNGPKVAAFARNIAGDVEAVTVDVWACRVADLDESKLGRKGAYDAVAHAYRLAAHRRGVAPSTMQATTWVVARGKAE